MQQRRSGDEGFTKVVLAGLLLAALVQAIPSLSRSDAEPPVQLTQQPAVTIEPVDSLTPKFILDSLVEIVMPVLPWMAPVPIEDSLRYSLP